MSLEILPCGPKSLTLTLTLPGALRGCLQEGNEGLSFLEGQELMRGLVPEVLENYSHKSTWVYRLQYLRCVGSAVVACGL